MLLGHVCLIIYTSNIFRSVITELVVVGEGGGVGWGGCYYENFVILLKRKLYVG